MFFASAGNPSAFLRWSTVITVSITVRHSIYSVSRPIYSVTAVMFMIRDHSLLTEVRAVRDLTRDPAMVDYD